MPSTDSSRAPSPFDPEVQAAVAAHMNGDHAADNVLIVRALGGQPQATAARMTGYDATAAHFEVHTTDQAEPVAAAVPWETAIVDRGTIRTEVVRMYHDACAALGVTPRGEAEH